jgi:hypothetical protein
MDRNLFWTRLNIFVGDIKFSGKSTETTPFQYICLETNLDLTTVPTHNLITTLSALPGAKSKRLYRCNVTLRNPFPGTPFYAVAGHHFVELAFQFMTLLERYPNPKLQETSIEFARRLIAFASGKAPWREFDEKDQAIAVVSSGDGWKTFTRAEDEVLGPLTEEGGRRYEAWETVQRVYERTGKSGQVLHEVLDVPEIMALALER